jgi:hypothetical protein
MLTLASLDVIILRMDLDMLQPPSQIASPDSGCHANEAQKRAMQFFKNKTIGRKGHRKPLEEVEYPRNIRANCVS